MDPISLQALAVVLVGFGSGILSGVVGVGGAVITKPGIRFLGATAVEGIGSTLPATLPGAVSGAVRFARAGLIDWRVGLVSSVVGVLFALIGAQVSDIVNAHVIMLLTAAMLLWSAWRTARSRPTVPAGGRDADPETYAAAVRATGARASGRRRSAGPANAGSTAGAPAVHHRTSTIAAIGAAAGFLAGLLGVGGGILLVPAYVTLLGLPPKRAVATSLVAVAIFSIPAMIAHAYLGHINWAFALLLGVGVVPGAQLGAHITITISEERGRVVIALLLAALGLVFAGRELVELV